MHKTKAFTLIELLVVISIISLLSTVVLASLNYSRAKARDATRLSDIQEINKAIQLYMFNNNNVAPFYNSDEEFTQLTISGRGWEDLEALLSPSYIPKLPVDPCPSCVDEQYYIDEDFGDLIESNSLRYVYIPCSTYFIDAGKCSNSSAYWLYPSGFETKPPSSFKGFNNGINY